MIKTYGMRVGSLISGSLIPPFFFVARAAIQSESLPLVRRPMNVPTSRAKLVKPTDWEEKLYGGAEKFWAWVKLIVRKLLADQETTKAAYSMMGKANSLHGVQNANRRALIG